MKHTLPTSLKSRPFTFKDALAKGLSQYHLQVLLRNGVIQRIERGLYTANTGDLADDELFLRAVKRVGEPAVVCLLSALSYHELTDLIPKQVWLMVPKEKRVKSPSVKLYRARSPLWGVGVEKKRGYAITSIERTIIDALTHRAIISPRMGIDALKTALTSKKTSVAKVLKIATQLGMEHRIIPYVEALS